MRLIRLLPLLALLLPHAAHAADAPLIYKTFRLETVVEKNGQAVQTLSVAMRANTQAALRQISQPSVPFVDGRETLELVEGSLIRADGRVTKLPKEAARPITDPAIGNQPGYEDRKRMTLVTADMEVGDTLTYTFRKKINQPAFPGHFALAATFSRQIEWQNAEVVINVPQAMPLAAEGRDVEATVENKGDRKILRWRYTAEAKGPDPAMLAPLDRLPRVVAGSFANWEQFAQGWGALVLPRAALTDTLRKRAEAITTGIAEPKAQAEAIYAWLLKTMRYVPLPLGSGSFEASSAEATLLRGSGDSKDIAVLAIALLRAKGIAAQPVLVNNATSYTLPEVANFSTLTHVLLQLPELGLIIDPSSRGTAFGGLTFLEYGKPALLIAADGVRRIRLDLLGEQQAATRVNTTMTMDANGNIIGDTRIAALGPFAGELRRAGLSLVANGPAQVAERQLRAIGMNGKGNYTGPDPNLVAPTHGMAGHFEVGPQRAWLEGEAFVLPLGLQLLPRPSDILMGPLEARDFPAGEPTPCFTGQQEEEIVLNLPKGMQVPRVPADVNIEADSFFYTSTWKLEPGRISVRRVAQMRSSEVLCTGKLREEIVAAQSRIRRDLAARIWIEAK